MTQGLGLFTEKKLQDLRDLHMFAPDYFKALGLVWGYQYMMKLADQGITKHREFRRVAAFKTMLINHFKENWDKHIDVSSNRIFSGTAIGGIADLKAWQRAGHSTRRTKKNYPMRLRVWTAIYEEKNLLIPNPNYQHMSSSHDLFTESDDRRRKRQVKKRFIELGRVKDKEGNIVTYDLVIRKRNKNYGAARESVPFWFVLNYGAGNITGERSGYPALPGVFFVEQAEQRLDYYQMRALYWYERFAMDVLTKENQGGNIADAYGWVRKKKPSVRLDYLPDQYDIARSLAEVF